MIRLALDESQFRRLVAGEVVRFKAGGDQRVEVECVLADIGWPKMLRAVVDGMTPGMPKGPSDPPEAREFLLNPYTRRPE